MTEKNTSTKTIPSNSYDESGLAIASMALGIASLTGFLIITGLPAVILGIISLVKQKGGKAFSIVGIVTGALSTLFSLAIIALIVLVLAIGYASFEDGYIEYNQRDSSDRQAPLNV